MAKIQQYFEKPRYWAKIYNKSSTFARYRVLFSRYWHNTIGRITWTDTTDSQLKNQNTTSFHSYRSDFFIFYTIFSQIGKFFCWFMISIVISQQKRSLLPDGCPQQWGWEKNLNQWYITLNIVYYAKQWWTLNYLRLWGWYVRNRSVADELAVTDVTKYQEDLRTK